MSGSLITINDINAPLSPSHGGGLFKCDKCSAQYSHKKNLKTHKKKVHHEKINKTFPCLFCNSQFNYQKNLKAHLRSKHNEQCGQEIEKKTESIEENAKHKKEGTSKAKKKKNAKNSVEVGKAKRLNLYCPSCRFLSSRKEMLKHLAHNHGTNVTSSDFAFDNFDEFETWKQEEENATKNNFPIETKQQHVTPNGKTTKHFYYQCHRSGNYKPKGNGLRNLKIHGSKKINGFCPASIKATQYEDGSCRGKYVQTHFGHEPQIEHMFTVKNDKVNIASKLAQGIKKNRIIEDIRNSVPISERLYYTSKRDLDNWGKAFDVGDDGKYHPNDAISVDAWVKKKKEENELLYYKPQGTTSGNFDEDCFILIFSTDDQIRFLREFGQDIVTSNSTHGMGYAGFQLVTVMVIDGLLEGFPCAFMITNHVTQETLKLFYKSIKDKCGGVPITTQTFMSDMEDSFHNAWSDVMGKPQNILYSAWHVVEAWKHNIKEKVDDVSLQDEVYTKLRVLLQTLDVNTFEIILPITLRRFQEISPAFAKYFQDHYDMKKKLWAYCYRTGLGINTNMALEKIHGIVKHNFFDGKQMKRLDHVVYRIEKFTKRKVENAFISKVKGKISTKIAVLRKRHTAAENLPRDNVIKLGNMWLVPSSNKHNPENYEVTENAGICNCAVVCKLCNSCIHRFKCNCFDSALLGNMCKHIHLRGIITQEMNSTTTNSSHLEEMNCFHQTKNELIPLNKLVDRRK